MLFTQLDSGSVDAAILDGEASPVGGLGIAKQMKDEYDPAPPTLVLLGRATTAGWPTGHAPRRRPCPGRSAGSVGGVRADAAHCGITARS